jgi:hypothetical protein
MALVNAVSQEVAGLWLLWKRMPCHLGAGVCQELHQLEKCRLFKKLSPEQRVVKVIELRLCLLCMKHTSDKKCY